MNRKRTEIKLFRNPTSFQIKVCDKSSLDEEPVPKGGVSTYRGACTFAVPQSETEYVQLTIARHVDLTVDDSGFGKRSATGIVPWSGGSRAEKRFNEIGGIEGYQLQLTGTPGPDKSPDNPRASSLLTG